MKTNYIFRTRSIFSNLTYWQRRCVRLYVVHRACGLVLRGDRGQAPALVERAALFISNSLRGLKTTFGAGDVKADNRVELVRELLPQDIAVGVDVLACVNGQTLAWICLHSILLSHGRRI